MALICAAEIDRGVAPGTRAGYQTSVVALLLAEVVSRKRGRDFREVIRDEVFLPLGMKDSWLGMPPETLELYLGRLGQTFDTSGPEPKTGSWAPDSPQQLTHVMPGGNGRGPMRELVSLSFQIEGEAWVFRAWSMKAAGSSPSMIASVAIN
jgi:CubicO group peptidase (beta-lactamase class C family)